MATFDPSTKQRFAARFAGSLLEPGAPGYEEARTVWNAMIDRHPKLIAQCASRDDIAVAIRFAREHDLPISVRGGGHNVAGTAVCDAGMMIDLSRLKRIEVDAPRRRASVEPGCTLGEVDRTTQEYALAVPLGINSTTGIAGLTLGGGFGWLSRQFGLTIDYLRKAEVVTTDGEVIQASADEHPDLFWAIRGGGGNFGVVSEFTFDLEPVGPHVFTGLLAYPISELHSVMGQFVRSGETAPEDRSVWALVRQAPPLPFLPTEVHGSMIVALILFSTNLERGPAWFEELRRLGTVLGETSGRLPYVAWQQMFDPLLDKGARNYWKSLDFARLNTSFIEALATAAADLPSSQSEIFVANLGGRVSTVDPATTAYNGREASYVMNVHARWEKPIEDRRCIDWARRVFARVEPLALDAAYVNFLTQDESSRVQRAYGPNYPRLVEVKRRYDPTNIFRFNQNIRPS